MNSDKNKGLTPICIVYVDGVRLDTEMEGGFRSVRITDALNTIGGCTAQFSCDSSKEIGENTFQTGSELSVHLGYKDHTEEVFNGEIVNSSFSLQEWEAAVYTVHGQSYLHQLSHSLQHRVFENMNASKIIKKILGKYGLEADCKDFGQERERWEEKEMSDWDFVRALADQYGRDIYCFGKKVYVKEQMTMHKDEHVYEYGKSLLSFKGKMSVLGLSTEVNVIGHDDAKNQDFVATSRLAELGHKIGGTKDWTAVFHGSTEGMVHTYVNTGAVDKSDAKEIAAALMRKESYDFIRGTGRAEGDPSLAAGEIVTIKGTGLRYNGDYMAEKVQHEMGVQSGYVTAFSLKRNALEAEAAKQLNPNRIAPQTNVPPPAVKEEEIAPPPQEAEPEPPREILEVKCLDENGSETDVYATDTPITLEATVNENVEEGAETTFEVYEEGADPQRDEPVTTLQAIVNNGKATVKWLYEHRRELSTVQGTIAAVTVFVVAAIAGTRAVRSRTVEVQEEAPAEEPAKHGVIPIIAHFNQQGTDAHKATKGVWGRLPIPGMKVWNNGVLVDADVSGYGCAITFVANVAFTHDPGTAITPETIRKNEAYFDGKGNIYWVNPLTDLGFEHLDFQRVEEKLTAEKFEEYMNDTTNQFYIGICVNSIGTAGDSAWDHWVGASELVTRDVVDPATGVATPTKFFKISPTSQKDWDIRDAAGNLTERGIRGWQAEGDNVYVPLSQLRAKYRVYPKPPVQKE